MTDSVDAKQFETVAQHLYPGSKLLRAWTLAGGLSAQMTALELLLADGQPHKLVIRQPGSATLGRNPNAAAEEFHLLQVLQSSGVSVPIPYHLDQSREVFPAPYLVIEYVDGKMEFSPADPLYFACQIAAQLAKIHQIDGTMPYLAFVPKAPGIAGKVAELSASQNVSPDENRIRAVFASTGALPTLNRTVLLHGDFWPGNLLWKNDRLAAVVDWEDAQIGDPLADFAISRLDTLLIFGPGALHEFTRCYQAATQFDLAHLPYWDLYAALRAAPHLAEWAAGYPQLGRSDVTENTMREGHQWFVAQALEKLPADKRP
jgi:aminoglycoside phosphotransferase (APT) family kinase protein